jgi:hypothetical protein
MCDKATDFLNQSPCFVGSHDLKVCGRPHYLEKCGFNESKCLLTTVWKFPVERPALRSIPAPGALAWVK